MKKRRYKKKSRQRAMKFEPLVKRGLNFLCSFFDLRKFFRFAASVVIFTTVLSLLAVGNSLFVSRQAGATVQPAFTENFSTTTYKGGATNATWDIGFGDAEAGKTEHSWVDLSAGTSAAGDGIEGGLVNSIAISPNYASDNTLFAANGFYVYKSIDGGDSWSKAGNISAGSGGMVFISPNYATDSTVLVVTTDNYASITTDGGTTWTKITSLPQDTLTDVVFSPDYATDKTIFILSGDSSAPSSQGVLISINGGTTWTRKDDTNGLKTNGNSDIGAIAISPDFADDKTIFVGYADCNIYKSTDSGDNWNKVGTVESALGLADCGGVNSLVVSPSYDDNGGTDGQISKTLWVGVTSGGVYKSTNGGATWSASNTGNDIEYVSAPRGIGVAPSTACSSISDCTLFAGGLGSGAGSFKPLNSSTDGAANWSASASGYLSYNIVSDIAFMPAYDGSSNKTLFISTFDAGIFKSTDGGTTWTKKNEGLPVSLNDVYYSPDYTNDKTIIASAAGGMFGAGAFVSTDRGQTWSSLYDPNSTNNKIPFPQVRFIGFSPSYATDKTIYAVIDDMLGEVIAGRLYKSTNNGSTWSQVSAAGTGTFLSVRFSDSYNEDESDCVANPDNCTVFLNGNTFIAKSLDKGSTWSTIKSAASPISGVAVSPNYSIETEGGTLYISYGATISKSIDGGVSWTDTTVGVSTIISLSPTYNEDESDCETNPKNCTFYLWLNPGDGTSDIYKVTDKNPVSLIPPASFNSDISVLSFGAGGPLVFSPNYANDGIVYASFTGAGIYYTVDDGSNWYAVNTGLSDDAAYTRVMGISPNYVNDKELSVAGFRGGLYRSFSYTAAADTKAVSSNIDSTIENINTATLTATASAPTGTSITYEMSNDGGSTWESVTSGSAHQFSSQGSDLRWRATFSGTTAISPSLSNVAITFGNTAPAAPSLSAPANGATVSSLNPVFTFSASDSTDTSDELFYELKISRLDGSLINTIYTFSQKEDSAGWSQPNPYSSGSMAAFTLPSGFSLSAGAAYYWTVRAVDNNGGASSWASAYSFNTPSSVISDTFDTITYRDSSNSDVQWGTAAAGVIKMAADMPGFGTATAALGSSATIGFAKGDFDGDGDLDIVVASNNSDTILYINDGSGSFSAGQNFGTAATTKVDAADLDNDGDLDLVFGNSSAQSKMWLNDGSGIFTSYDRFGSSCVMQEDNIAIADFNKDGYQDVVVGCDDTTTTADTLFLNNGVISPDFTSDTDQFGSKRKTEAMEAGDFDGDGDADLVIAYNNETADLYTNNGAGTFTKTDLDGGTGAYELVAGDYEGDGDLDLFFSIFGSDSQIAINDGLGNFTFATIGSGDGGSCGIAVGDLDGDGDKDAVTVRDATCGVSAANSLIQGGYLASSTTISSAFDSDDSWAVEIFDVDSDGDLDVVVGNNGQNYIYKSNRAASFTGETPVAFDTAATRDLVPADVDNDGDQDLVTWRSGAQNYAYINDGTGTFTAKAIGGSSATVSSMPADFTGDGYLDVIVYEGGVLKLYAGSSNGTFSVDSSYTFSQDINGTIYPADVDNDGDLDLLIATSASGDNYLGTNNGSGFTLAAAFGTDATDFILPVDVNGDGDLDAVAANSAGQNKLYTNDGSGSFTSSSQFGANNTTGLAVADLDNDGYQDVVVGNDGTQSYIYWNVGDGSFYAQDFFGTDQIDVAASDIDSDGDIDILVNDRDTSKQYIYYNYGKHSFVKYEVASLSNLQNFKAADLDNDGDKDLIAPNGSGGTHYLYRQGQTYSGTATAESTTMATATAAKPILTATLTASDYAPGSSSISYYLSADGGVSWEGPVTSGTKHIFENTGTDLRWKADLKAGSSPLIYNVSLDYSVPGSTPPTLVDCSKVDYTAAPPAPLSCGGEAVSENAINWTYTYADYSRCQAGYPQEGFKLYKEEGNAAINKELVKGIDNKKARLLEEENLKPNTKYTNRQVYAYRPAATTGDDLLSAAVECSSAYTLAPAPKLSLVSADHNSLTIQVKNIPNLGEGRSALQWKIEQVKDDIVEYISKTDWLTGGSSYTFRKLKPETSYKVSVRARNGDGMKTDWSSKNFSTVKFAPSLILTKTATIVSGAGAANAAAVKGIKAVSRDFFNGSSFLLSAKLRQARALRYLSDFSALFSIFLLLALLSLIYHLYFWHKTKRIALQRKYRLKATYTMAAAITLGVIKIALVATMASIGTVKTIEPPAEYPGDGATLEPADKLVYHLIYENATEQSLPEVEITDTLPAGVELDDNPSDSTEGTHGFSYVYDKKDNTLTFTLKRLAVKPAGFGTINIPVKVKFPLITTESVRSMDNTAKAAYTLNGDSKTVYSNTIKNPLSLASVSGTVFKDTNGNGKFDQGEGSNGAKISLSYDSNSNNKLDNLDQKISSATTAEHGSFSFNGLRRGKYFISGDKVDVLSFDLVSGQSATEKFVEYRETPAKAKKEEKAAPPKTSPQEPVAPLAAPKKTTVPSAPAAKETALPSTSKEARPEELRQLERSGQSLENFRPTGPEKTKIEVTIGVVSVAVEVGVEKPTLTTKPSTAKSKPSLRDVGLGRTAVKKVAINAPLEDRKMQANFNIKMKDAIVGQLYELVTLSDPQAYPFVPDSSDYIIEIAAMVSPGEHHAYVRTVNRETKKKRIVSNIINFQANLPLCYDGLDNDGDGFTDFPADPGCLSIQDNDEFDAPVHTGVEAFTDEVINIAKNIVEATAETFDDPRVEKATANYVAPALLVIAVANASTALTLLTLLPYLQFIFTEPLRLLSRKKRKGWGVVYDSFTKRPVDLAIVRLVNKATGAQIGTKVTDRLGRYAFIVKDPGTYIIKVTKPQYQYPSQTLKDKKEDISYLDLYHGEPIEVSQGGAVITANIPLDPQLEEKTNKKVLALTFARKIQNSVSLSGMALSAVTVIIVPKLIIIILLLLHLMLYFLFRRLSYPKKPKSWGIVYDKKNKRPLNKAIIRIFDTKFNKLLGTQVTDARGRYGFLVGQNVYYLTAARANYQPYKSPELDLEKKEAEAITLDMGLVREEKKGNQEIKKSPKAAPPKPENQEIPKVPSEQHYTDSSKLKEGQFPEGKES